MKSSLSLLFLLLAAAQAVPAFAAGNATEDNKTCATLFEMAIFNSLLEDNCKFTGGVSTALHHSFKEICAGKLSKQEIQQIGDDVIENTTSRAKQSGKQKFCANNQKAYNNLVKALTDAQSAPAAKADNETCVKLAETLAFNGYLERTCGYEGSVAMNLGNKFAARCNYLSWEAIDKIKNYVIADSTNRYNLYGHKKFCSENLEPYSTLDKALSE